MPRRPATTPVSARLAGYCRTSSDDQAERQTVEAQREFLRRYCDLHELPVFAVYVDDGVSGTLPLDQRPEGRRLLADAAAGRFGAVLVYRLDRLGRNLRALLDAHDQLSDAGVSIRSATEPFDTATPIGQFLFQLLGSLAELERSTIVERMTLGRDRVAREGRTTGGRIAFGYDVAPDGRIVPSTRPLACGQTEAEVAASIFARVAEGATLHAECARLEALGVPALSRWPGTPDRVAARWYPSRLHQMIANPLYRGVHEIASRHGPVSAAVDALVSPEVWQAAQTAMTRNRDLSAAGDQRQYLLRGLAVCRTVLDDGSACGRRYGGGPGSKPLPDGTRRLYYHCSGTRHTRDVSPARPRCQARSVPMAALDAAVWREVRQCALHPRGYLAAARADLDDQAGRVAAAGRERDALTAALAGRGAERDRAQLLFRRGLADLDETTRALGEIDAATAELQAMLRALDASAAGVVASQTYLDDLTLMLDGLVPLVAAGDAGDADAQRQVVSLLVRQIDLVTTLVSGAGARPSKQVSLTIRYRLGSGSLQNGHASWKLPDADGLTVARALALA